MDWLREQVPWLSDAAGLAITLWVSFTGLVSGLVGAVVAAVLLRRDVAGLKLWRKKHEQESEVGFADLDALRGQVLGLVGRFGAIERAQAEASARATEDRHSISDLLTRIDTRLEALDAQQDERFTTLTKRSDGVVDARLRGK